MIITSKDNEMVKHVRKLKEKKFRDAFCQYVVEGFKMVEEAIDEKARIVNIYIREDEAISESLSQKLYQYDCFEVEDTVFQAMSDVVNPQGILAVIEKEENQDIDYSEDQFLLLDNIQDPGNMGTIVRTLDSLGVKQVFVTKGSADVYNPKVVRSTMGAIYRVKVIEVENMPEFIDKLKEHVINVYATDLATDNSIYDVDFTKSAIIIGNEAKGVSEEVKAKATDRIKIPMIGKTESLNAAVATSIIMYEANRSRGRFNK